LIPGLSLFAFLAQCFAKKDRSLSRRPQPQGSANKGFLSKRLTSPFSDTALCFLKSNFELTQTGAILTQVVISLSIRVFLLYRRVKLLGYQS
jgi:hypothetical protein